MSPAIATLVRVLALLLMGWIMIPPIMFALGRMRLRCEVREDPASAEPQVGDPDYERRYRQFRELGFLPIGITFESAWFLTVFKWHWRSLEGSRFLVSADGRTFVSFHRQIREEPVRFGATTVFEGDALVRTACPGIVSILADYRLYALRKVEPAALLDAHADYVESFTRETGRAVRQATLPEVASIDIKHSRRLILGLRKGLAETKFHLISYGLPSLAAFVLLPRSLGTQANRLALAMCLGGAFFAYVRFVLLESARKQVALRSHTEDVTSQKKES